MKVFIKIFKITTPVGHTNLHIMNCNFMKRGRGRKNVITRSQHLVTLHKEDDLNCERGRESKIKLSVK